MKKLKLIWMTSNNNLNYIKLLFSKSNQKHLPILMILKMKSYLDKLNDLSNYLIDSA
jgi:hypothetical protein